VNRLICPHHMCSKPMQGKYLERHTGGRNCVGQGSHHSDKGGRALFKLENKLLVAERVGDRGAPARCCSFACF